MKDFNHALLEGYPDDPIMLFTAAKCYSKKGENKKASKFLELAQQKTKKSQFWKDLVKYMRKFDKYDVLKYPE